MNKLTVSLMVTSALALSACGGGGGSDSVADNPTGNQHSHAAFQGVMENGSGIVSTGSDALATLMVNDKSVELQLPNIYARSMTILPNGINVNGKAYEKFIVSGPGYANSKFGYIVDEVTGKQGVAFSQGKLTQDMPTQGNATYHGSSVYVNHDAATYGNALLNVDFANKTLNGTLKDGELSGLKYQVDFSGVINGNTFRSNADSNTEVAGRFYGEHAAEAGGVFKAKDGSYRGAFGATKSAQ